jgi:nucleoid DNA-binding protein
MEEIAELFVELLRTHDRVSLPGMGAFVAVTQPASMLAGRIAPPSKKVAFLRSETWNDGLLEQLYAARHRLSAEEAREQLRSIITDIRYGLDANGKFALPGFGTLKQTASRDLTFSLNKNVNLQDDSYGLDEIPIASTTPETRTKPKKNTKAKAIADNDFNIPTGDEAADGGDNDSERPEGRNSASLLLFGMMLVAIVAVVVVIWLRSGGPENGVEAMINSSANVEQKPAPASKKPASAPAPPAADEPAADEPEEEYIVYEPKTPPAPATTKPAAAKTKGGKECEFCTVVASFPQMEQARLSVKRYEAQGYAPVIKDNGKGYFRVALGCYSSYDVAKKQLNDIAATIRDAWILEDCK